MNQPCDATYTVTEDHTTVYVCDPAVLQYFTDSRFLGMDTILKQLRDPSTDAARALLKETVEGLRFYKMGDSVDRMNEGFKEVKSQKEPDIVIDEALEKRIHLLVSLLQRVFIEEEDKKEHKEGVEFAASAGVQIMQSLQIPSIVNWVLGLFEPWGVSNQPSTDNTESASETNMNLDSVDSSSNPSSDDSSSNPPPIVGQAESSLPPIDEKQINKALHQFLHRNNLNDYTDEQLLAVLMSFRYDSPSDSAAYLLFVLLAGISEPCRITREEFEKQAKLAGILTKENQNQLMEFFFHSKNTIDFEDYWKLLHSSSIPSSFVNVFCQKYPKIPG